MTLNVDYTLPDTTWVRKAIPPDWRQASPLVDAQGVPLGMETDQQMAARCAAIFGLPEGTVANLKLRDVPPDPIPGPSLEETVATLQAQMASLSAKGMV